MSTWIFLRGWAREARHWGDFPARFADGVPGARVLTPDLPGTGAAHNERAPASVPAMLEKVRGQLSGEPPYFLFGLSLGGMVSVEWALRHPGEVAGCVLANTSLRPVAAFHERLHPRNYVALARIALVERDARVREASILRLTSASGGSSALAATWALYAEERPLSRANALRQLLAAARYRAQKRPSPSLLILAGAGDRLVDPQCSMKLAQRWSAPLAVHPGAGHDLALDAPDWVIEQVRGWLKRT